MGEDNKRNASSALHEFGAVLESVGGNMDIAEITEILRASKVVRENDGSSRIVAREGSDQEGEGK